MKRILLIAATAAMLLEPLTAAAQGHGRGDGDGRWGRGGGRGAERYEGRGRDEGRGRAPDRYEGRAEPRGGGPGYGRGGRWGDRDEGRGQPRYEPRPDARRREDPRNAPPPYVVPQPRGERSWRQGQYLPPAYRGSVVRDPSRFRLRRPPPGYDWVGVGEDIYLMQRSTGLVLDTIPGGF